MAEELSPFALGGILFLLMALSSVQGQQMYAARNSPDQYQFEFRLALLVSSVLCLFLSTTAYIRSVVGTEPLSTMFYIMQCLAFPLIFFVYWRFLHYTAITFYRIKHKNKEIYPKTALKLWKFTCIVLTFLYCACIMGSVPTAKNLHLTLLWVFYLLESVFLFLSQCGCFFIMLTVRQPFIKALMSDAPGGTTNQTEAFSNGTLRGLQQFHSPQPPSTTVETPQKGMSPAASNQPSRMNSTLAAGAAAGSAGRLGISVTSPSGGTSSEPSGQYGHSVASPGSGVVAGGGSGGSGGSGTNVFKVSNASKSHKAQESRDSVISALDLAASRHGKLSKSRSYPNTHRTYLQAQRDKTLVMSLRGKRQYDLIRILNVIAVVLLAVSLYDLIVVQFDYYVREAEGVSSQPYASNVTFVLWFAVIFCVSSECTLFAWYFVTPADKAQSLNCLDSCLQCNLLSYWTRDAHGRLTDMSHTDVTHHKRRSMGSGADMHGNKTPPVPVTLGTIPSKAEQSVDTQNIGSKQNKQSKQNTKQNSAKTGQNPVVADTPNAASNTSHTPNKDLKQSEGEKSSPNASRSNSNLKSIKDEAKSSTTTHRALTAAAPAATIETDPKVNSIHSKPSNPSNPSNASNTSNISDTSNMSLVVNATTPDAGSDAVTITSPPIRPSSRSVSKNVSFAPAAVGPGRKESSAGPMSPDSPRSFHSLQSPPSHLNAAYARHHSHLSHASGHASSPELSVPSPASGGASSLPTDASDVNASQTSPKNPNSANNANMPINQVSLMSHGSAHLEPLSPQSPPMQSPPLARNSNMNGSVPDAAGSTAFPTLQLRRSTLTAPASPTAGSNMFSTPSASPPATPHSHVRSMAAAEMGNDQMHTPPLTHGFGSGNESNSALEPPFRRTSRKPRELNVHDRTNAYGRKRVPKHHMSEESRNLALERYMENPDRDPTETSLVAPGIGDRQITAAPDDYQYGRPHMMEGQKSASESVPFPRFGSTAMGTQSGFRAKSILGDNGDLGNMMNKLRNDGKKRNQAVSLIIYEFDNVLATLENKLNRVQQEADQAVSWEQVIDHADPLKFELMFGGPERVRQLKNHLNKMMGLYVEPVPARKKTSSDFRGMNATGAADDEKGLALGGDDEDDHDEDGTTSGGSPQATSPRAEEWVRHENPKCFIFTKRDSIFVTSVLVKIGLLYPYFSSTVQQHGQWLNLSHVIGYDHALMQENQMKTHLIVLQLIRFLDKDHDSVLYIGANKEVIEHMKGIKACNTYQVETKGMVAKDMKRIEKKFLG